MQNEFRAIWAEVRYCQALVSRVLPSHKFCTSLIFPVAILKSLIIFEQGAPPFKNCSHSHVWDTPPPPAPTHLTHTHSRNLEVTGSELMCPLWYQSLQFLLSCCSAVQGFQSQQHPGVQNDCQCSSYKTSSQLTSRSLTAIPFPHTSHWLHLENGQNWLQGRLGNEVFFQKAMCPTKF